MGLKLLKHLKLGFTLKKLKLGKNHLHLKAQLTNWKPREASASKSNSWAHCRNIFTNNSTLLSKQIEMTYKSIPTVSCMTTVFDGFVHSTFVLLTYCISQHFWYLLNFNDRYMVGQMVSNVRITFSKATFFLTFKGCEIFEV